ncbi:MAG: tetratricopeptide repeat protein [Verrucomicrobia bacterium]|nr:tetratricopeptide repeat protein [Verrucomicrobiota bacterium]
MLVTITWPFNFKFTHRMNDSGTDVGSGSAEKRLLDGLAAQMAEHDDHASDLLLGDTPKDRFQRQLAEAVEVMKERMTRGLDQLISTYELLYHDDPESFPLAALDYLTKPNESSADGLMTVSESGEAATVQELLGIPDEALLSYGEVARRLFVEGKMAESADAYFYLVRLQPLSPDFLIGYGSAEYRLGNFELAVAAFEAAKTLAPEILESSVFLARSYSAMGQPREAIAQLDEVERHLPLPEYSTYREDFDWIEELKQFRDELEHSI